MNLRWLWRKAESVPDNRQQIFVPGEETAFIGAVRGLEHADFEQFMSEDADDLMPFWEAYSERLAPVAASTGTDVSVPALRRDFTAMAQSYRNILSRRSLIVPSSFVTGFGTRFNSELERRLKSEHGLLMFDMATAGDTSTGFGFLRLYKDGKTTGDSSVTVSLFSLQDDFLAIANQYGKREMLDHLLQVVKLTNHDNLHQANLFIFDGSRVFNWLDDAPVRNAFSRVEETRTYRDWYAQKTYNYEFWANSSYARTWERMDTHEPGHELASHVREYYRLLSEMVNEMNSRGTTPSASTNPGAQEAAFFFANVMAQTVLRLLPLSHPLSQFIYNQYDALDLRQHAVRKFIDFARHELYFATQLVEKGSEESKERSFIRLRDHLFDGFLEKEKAAALMPDRDSLLQFIKACVSRTEERLTRIVGEPDLAHSIRLEFLSGFRNRSRAFIVEMLDRNLHSRQEIDQFVTKVKLFRHGVVPELANALSQMFTDDDLEQGISPTGILQRLEIAAYNYSLANVHVPGNDNYRTLHDVSNTLDRSDVAMVASARKDIEAVRSSTGEDREHRELMGWLKTLGLS